MKITPDMKVVSKYMDGQAGGEGGGDDEGGQLGER